jgi:DNA polymerase-3 subunit alpha
MALDDAMREAQVFQKDRISNQTDIFLSLGAGNEEKPSREIYPTVEEWTAQQQRFREGSARFYITGHPLDKHEKLVKRLTSGSIASLKKPFNGEVKVGGVVTALKLKNTKKAKALREFPTRTKQDSLRLSSGPTFTGGLRNAGQDDPILVQETRDGRKSTNHCERHQPVATVGE